VFLRLRYKVSLRDLAEMYSVKGFYFTRECVRDWEEKYAPLITDELKTQRKGKADQRWKADEVLLKVKTKFHYLYRTIDSQGQLVEVKLCAWRNSETTTAFLSRRSKRLGISLSKLRLIKRSVTLAPPSKY
jgi:putative transposase